MPKSRKHKRSKSSTRRTRNNVVAALPAVDLPRTGVSRVPQVLGFFLFSRTTLHRLVAGKKFPAPIRLSPGLIGFDNRKLWQYVESGGQWTEPQEEKAAA